MADIQLRTQGERDIRRERERGGGRERERGREGERGREREGRRREGGKTSGSENSTAGKITQYNMSSGLLREKSVTAHVLHT